MKLLMYLFLGVLFGQPPSHVEQERNLRNGEGVSPLKDSAIYEVVGPSSASIPKTIEALKLKMLNTFTRVNEIIVPFSRAPGDTDLREPRILFGSETGDLYVGVIDRENGSVDIEFISFNKRTRQNDFGVIRNFGKPNAEVVAVDKSACIVCHKNEGPLFIVGGWRNTLGADTTSSSSLGIHRAFVAVLADRHPRYKAFRDGFESIMEQYPPSETDFDRLRKILNELLALEKRLGRDAHWNGIDLSSVVQSGNGFEKTVLRGNQLLVLDAYVRDANSDGLRKERIQKIIDTLIGVNGHVLVGQDPWDKEFENLRKNRASLLSDNPLFEKRMPHFDFSRSHFLEYNRLKREGKFLNTVAENSPTQESSFLPYTHPIGGTGTVGTFEALNPLYRMPLRNHFGKIPCYQGSTIPPMTSPRVGDLLKERFLRLYPRLSEGDCFNKASEFFDFVMNEFKQSSHLKSLIESGQLPTPREVEFSFIEFIEGKPLPASVLPRAALTSPALAVKKLCMDCHRSSVANYPFVFEMSSLEAWKSELSSTNSAVKASAFRWIPSVLSHLKGNTMPPSPFTLDINERQRSELIQFLQSKL